MRPQLQGVDGPEALFDSDGRGVVVNVLTLQARSVKLEDELSSRAWLAPDAADAADVWQEVAECALEPSPAPTSATAAQHRGYTIPKACREAASDALDAPRSLNCTAPSLITARTLAAGGQVSLSQVGRVYRYFERHQPGDEGWHLWGGDEARRWAEGVVQKVGVHAAGDPTADLASFYWGDEDQRGFYAQPSVPLSGQVVSLYSLSPEGHWLTWLDGQWVPAADGDVPEQLVELDDDAAVYVGGSLYDAPDAPVDLRSMDPEEWDMHVAAMGDVDWDLVDRTMVAAGTGHHGDQDGNYTPQERSRNVQSQPRDKNGRFASVGDQGTMSDGQQARIITVNPVDNSLIVRTADGRTYSVPAREFEINGAPQPVTQHPGNAQAAPKLDFSKILGQPRAIGTTPKGLLPHLLPPMNAAALKSVMRDYEGFIERERRQNARKFRGGTGYRERDPGYHPHLPWWSSDPKELRKDLKKQEKRAHPRGVIAAGEPGGVVDNPLAAPPSPDPGKLNPETSDVKPLYLAIVDHDDPQAVTDLAAMVPSSTDSSQTTVFRRVAGEWIEDVRLLQEMRSPTPPPVVKLDDATYADVLQQVDSAGTEGAADEKALADVRAAPAPVAAAGGLDQNRGNAETLRRYWLYGKGALKIRWGTGGDWTRCYRHLAKYMGPRAKGYCALRHHEATGMWPGDRRNVQGLGAGGARMWDAADFIRPMDDVLDDSVMHARADVARRKMLGEQGVIPVKPEDAGGGPRFKIPMVIPEGVESGDGRTFEQGSLRVRTLPVSLLWQQATGEGHGGSVVVGRVDSVERVPGGLGNAYGVLDDGPDGQEMERLIRNGMLKFVSADLDQFKGKKQSPDELAEGDDTNVENDKLTINHGRLMAVTVVAKPAFEGCTIELIPDDEEEPPMPADGIYEGEAPAGAAMTASARIALAIPVTPPRDWFERPALRQPTALTVTEDGKVFGHVATWDMDHIGLPGARRAPRSASGYAYFHTGVVETEDGSDVPVGQLTLSGGHADLTADAAMAVKHYDDTGSAIADVHVGEDSYGIWAAGALRPGTTPEQIRQLRASAPSGDWRVINGRLELVAVCQVNVPGFPVTRALAASGHVFALVAAGAQTLARQRSSMDVDLASRIQRLEASEHRRDEARALSARERMAPLLESREARRTELETLAASARTRVWNVLGIDGYLEEFKDFSPEKRQALAGEKKALPDGSYPIESAADLRRAVHAYGRATEDKQPRVRRHIVRRARALEKPDMIPQGWAEAALTDRALDARDARETLTAAAYDRDQRNFKAKAAELSARVHMREGELTLPTYIIEGLESLAKLSDEDFDSLTEAAVGVDTHPLDAERLRQYWEHGEGAAKIRWGTPGDFDRCVRHLEKYMPGRAKGYCNLRHKGATGEYPATHAKELRGSAGPTEESE